jgi:hypothetical protein
LAQFLGLNIQKVDAIQLQLAPGIEFILNEVMQWKKVPDKCEPLTPAMWSHRSTAKQHHWWQAIYLHCWAHDPSAIAGLAVAFGGV